jgi:ATP-dependent exoDNAse (exonuclease V) beta subunit
MRATPFTSAQLEAIDISKRHLDICVVAGPGSGKTTVLVEYFARLVGAGVDPLRILAITFTEKAAANMRAKLAEQFEGVTELRAQFERAWVFTIHGFCARLLREQAVWAGIDPEFAIADEQESLRMQQESLGAAMEEVFAHDAEAVRALIRGLSSPEFEEHVRSAYDAMRCSGVSPSAMGLQTHARDGSVTAEQIEIVLESLRAAPRTAWSYPQKQHLAGAIESAERIVSAETPRQALLELEEFPLKLPKCKRSTEAYELATELRDLLKDYKYTLITQHYAPQRALLIDILLRFDRIYRERKRRAGLLDFPDLEEYAVRLLETHPEAQARLRAQFDHVLMDELQDTNPQQAKLINLVRPANRFYAVGDINQSIYGFRHAEPRGFAEYRRQVESGGGHLVELVENFRSRPEILSAVETITSGREGIERRSLVAGRTFTDKPETAVEVIGVNAEPADAAARIEARHIAKRIVELANSECEFKDIAVLVRNTEVLTDLAPAFDEAGIPYLVNRGKGFYETREVNDLVHLLRVIANPLDEISLATVLRSPLVAVSDEALLRLRMLGVNIGSSLWRITPEHAADFGEDYSRLARFRERLHDWRARREYVSFDRLLLEAMDECGYRPETGSRGAANIDRLLAQARAARSKMTLDQFVEELEQVRKSNPREADAPPEDSANAVKVMTVHAAKGLEFPVAFVAAMQKGIDSDAGVAAFSPRIGLGARWRNPAVREDKNDVFQHAIREERKAREAEESHRLLYVAMTRAEKRLILSFSGAKPKEWARVAVDSLRLDMDSLGEETVEQIAPDGKRWNLRVTIADRAPELLRAESATDSAGDESVELLDAPSGVAQQDANATVTALAKFAKCPREYYLAHYLGFEGRRRIVEEDSETESDLPADEFGVQVHALLAGTEVEKPAREALRLAQVFRDSPLGRRAAKATRIEREFDFLMSVEELVIRGQVDLWFEEGGELVIVDYKTDAVTAVEAHQRARDYALQLRLYAQAVERIAGRAPDRAWLHFLRPNVAIEVDLTPSLLDAPEQIARDLQDAQSSLHFPMNIAEHCRRCQFYRGLCPSQ